MLRHFRPDKWNKMLGSRIPAGAEVEVLRIFTRRRVLIRYQGTVMNTMLWCVPKDKVTTADLESLRSLLNDALAKAKG